MINRSLCRIAATFALATAAFAGPALADPPPTHIVSSIYADAANPQALTYDFWIANPGAATTVSIVWKNEGRVVGRQSLDVGSQPRWHSWSHRRRHGNENALTVDLVAADGSVIHTDTFTPGTTTPTAPPPR